MNGDGTALGVQAAEPPAAGTAPVPTPLYAPLTVQFRVVLVAPKTVPAWLARFIALVKDHDWLTLSVLPVAGAGPASAAPVPRDVGALLAREQDSQPATQHAFLPVALAGQGVAESQSEVEGALAELCRRLAAERPELVLLLGPVAWTAPLSDCATQGCWRLDASLSDPDAAAYALLGPLLHGEPATALALELDLQWPTQPALALVTSRGATIRASLSRQRDQAFMKLPALLLRALRRVAAGALSLPSQHYGSLRLDPGLRPRGPWAGVRAMVRTAAVRFDQRRRRARRPHDALWFVLLRDEPRTLVPANPASGRWARLHSTRGEIWADPCVVEDGGRRWLFVEQYTLSARKGVIACLELVGADRARHHGLILDLPHHLSYPQVFQHDGQWYMTVESGRARCVRLYRAEAFPLRWEPVADLIQGCVCVDPTLHHHDDGRWYLFANVAESGGSTWDELFLFVADKLEGPYRPHPANPIVADVRSARPAGRLFHDSGRLIRPAQDCAPSYGAATLFNEVLELSPSAYRERLLGRLDPGWGSSLDGCHTYSAGSSLEVLDARGVPPRGLLKILVV